MGYVRVPQCRIARLVVACEILVANTLCKGPKSAFLAQSSAIEPGLWSMNYSYCHSPYYTQDMVKGVPAYHSSDAIYWSCAFRRRRFPQSRPLFSGSRWQDSSNIITRRRHGDVRGTHFTSRRGVHRSPDAATRSNTERLFAARAVGKPDRPYARKDQAHMPCRSAQS